MNSTWARCTTPFEFDLNADPLQDVDQSLAWKFKTELDRLSTDNKNLSEILRDMCKKYITLQVQMTKLIRNENINESNYNDDQYPSLKLRDFTKNNISKVLVRCDAYDTSLVVKDGYQWRKYGQKVTKDNPSPRAYFRCSFAPYCHVKKKVQRSVKDKSVLVVIYEGRHNHKCISETKLLVGSSRDMNFGSAPPSAYCRSSESTLTIDSTKTSVCSDAQKPNQEIELPMEFKQFLVKQITSSLLNDPTFNSALLEPMLERTHEYEI